MKVDFYKNNMDDLWWIRLGIGYEKDNYLKQHSIVLSLGFHTLFIKWK